MCSRKQYKKYFNKLGFFQLNILIKGDIGLKTTVCGIFTPLQIEAARRVIVKKVKQIGVIWIRVPSTFVKTKKSSSSRMGKGIGLAHGSFFFFKKGTVIFELGNVKKFFAINVLLKASKKLPVSTKIISKQIFLTS